MAAASQWRRVSAPGEARSPWPLITADWNFWPDGIRGADAFAAASRLGFSGIEIGVYEAADLAPDRVRELQEWLTEHVLTLPAVLYSLPPKRWPRGGLTSEDEATRRRVIDDAVALARGAADLGASILGLWLGGDRIATAAHYPEAWRRLVDGVRTIARSIAPLGLELGFEYKPGEIIGNADAFLRIADAVAAPNLGLILDTGHALYGREDLVGVLKRCGDRLVHVHLDDNYGDYDRDLPPGAVHNFDAFFRALHESGYAGAISFDLYYGVAEEGLTGEEACRAGRDYVRDVIRRLGLAAP